MVTGLARRQNAFKSQLDDSKRSPLYYNVSLYSHLSQPITESQKYLSHFPSSLFLPRISGREQVLSISQPSLEQTAKIPAAVFASIVS
jgi:hypothetical protein